MKFSLYKKFFLFYILFAVLTIVFIGTAGYRLVYQSVLVSEQKQLYNEANTLAMRYRNSYGANTLDYETISPALTEIGNVLHVDIWVMNRNGHIDYSTSGANQDIVGFDPTGSNSYHGFVGDFFGTFNQEYISVYAPMASNFSTSGYILLHKPVSQLDEQINDTLNALYLTALVIFLLSLLLILLLHAIVLRPLKKITAAAKEYAAGNLTYEHNFHSNDEIGYLSQTLTYMAKALAETSEDQRKFVTNVSHDFRSPLTSIKGYIEAILDGTIPPSMQEKYLHIVQDETDRLNKLTQSLLDLNALNRNGTYLDYSDFDIHHIIKKILATFEGRCNDKRITFELTFFSREFFVHADEGKIQQVLYNLIDNAIKFSNPGSVIFIETDSKHDKAYISVKDQGVGIPADSLKKIWDRFYKTDTSRGKDKKGLGLGLSITREIIKAHGETIDVISTEDIGTQFIFTLPLGSEPSKN